MKTEEKNGLLQIEAEDKNGTAIEIEITKEQALQLVKLLIDFITK